MRRYLSLIQNPLSKCFLKLNEIALAKDSFCNYEKHIEWIMITHLDLLMRSGLDFVQVIGNAYSDQ